jgi:hypothetical protein
LKKIADFAVQSSEQLAGIPIDTLRSKKRWTLELLATGATWQQAIARIGKPD